MEIEDNYEEWSSERLLAYLAEHDISQPAGFAIEVYQDRFPITEDVVPVLERYLLSDVVNNRSVALEALAISGHRTGYTGDAVMLHFASRDEHGIEYHLTLRVLREMADQGDPAAKRASELLDRDPFVVGTRQRIERFQSQYGYD